MVDDNLPTLVRDQGVGNVAVVMSASDQRWFDNVGGGYTPSFAGQDTLAASGADLLYTTTDGTQITFNGFDPALPILQQGQFKQMTDAAGNITAVTSWVSGGPADGAIAEVQRQHATVISATVTQVATESWAYDYNADGLLASVTLRRKSFSYDPTAANADAQGASTAWTVVRKVSYEYYDGVQPYGNQGDLKTATVEAPSGAALSTQYYRYYTDGASGGFRGGLKYVFDGKSFDRLSAAVADPFNAADAQVAPYAAQFVQYDAQRRVTRHDLQGLGASGSGGIGTFTYAYTDNPADVSSSDPAASQPAPTLPWWLNASAYGSSNGQDNSANLNAWRFKTVETQPDGTQNVIYTNPAGGVMLQSHQEAGQQWNTFTKFDSVGRAVLAAHPSAVTGYSEAYADLLHAQGGNYQYLSDHAGLIDTTSYYDASFFNQPASHGVQQGELGTAVKLDDEQYATQTAAGKTVHPLSQQTVYRNTDGTGAQTTTYAYLAWQGVQPLDVLTTFPTVSAAQDGPSSTGSGQAGTADTTETVFDAYGRPVWTKDGDGYLHYTSYDDGTGAVVKTIADVNTADAADFTGLPAGWATPTGGGSTGLIAGGLNLVTTMAVDGLGRDTKVTDPNGNVTYMTYDDPDHEQRTYRGWQTATGTPTGPTEVVREDWANGYTETLTMTAAPHLGAGGAPDGAEAIGGVQALSRDYRIIAGQLIGSVLQPFRRELLDHAEPGRRGHELLPRPLCIR